MYSKVWIYPKCKSENLVDLDFTYDIVIVPEDAEWVQGLADWLNVIANKLGLRIYSKKVNK